MYKAIIVDDEQSVKRSLRKIIEMERLPFKIVGEANDGVEALDLIEKAKPELIITDICMPALDGLGLTSELRKREAPVEIVMISGYSHFEYAQQAMRHGVADYLLKPVDPDEVAATLKRIFHKLQQSRQDIVKKSEWLSACKLRLKRMIKLLWVLNEEAVRQELADVRHMLVDHKLNPHQLKEQYIGFLALMNAELMELSGERIGIKALCVYESLHYSEEIHAKTEEVLLELMDEIREMRNWASHKSMTKAINHIKNHYTDEDYSLKQAADIAGMSPTYFSKSFKEEMGQSYTEFLSNLRMDKAVQLLENPYNKVYEVAYAIGYSNYAHFAKVFKKNYGLSPTDYRNNLEVG